MTKLFIIEDDPIVAGLMKRAAEQLPNIEVSHYSNAQHCIDALHLLPDIIAIDYHLPDINGLDLMRKVKNCNSETDVIVVSGQEQVDVVVQAYKSGADDYIIKKGNFVIDFVNTVKNLDKAVSLRKEVEKLRAQVIDRNRYSNIIGNSPATLQVLRMIQKVENNSITVLVTGESGTGKELVGRALHYNSHRKNKSYVTVNMGAIPADLIESELFGHEKGAFTDAGKRIGRFEEADGGTIFLDEIGEMKLDLQTRLLRVLEEKEVTRVGSNKPIKLDVRVIAATNKDLSEEVKAGRFRQDLYYRLQGFLIQLPPLRKRGDDAILLAKHFLSSFCTNNRVPAKTFTKEALKMLVEHSWPGNIRELKAVVERAALLSDNDLIQAEDILLQP